MKKIISLILSLVMVLSFTACGTKAEATWQEHYDLGLKYVNEAKYDEAILAFTKALEIDPKQAPVYIALAEVYVRQENYTAAQETLDKAIAEIGQTDELLAEKENLNDKQTPQNNTGAEGGIPPQAGPFPSADAVPGVVRTDRDDSDDGGYWIFGYNAEGYEICTYSYNADGSLDWYVINTYDANGNSIREDGYDADGRLDGYFICTCDANGNHIRQDEYDADGSLDWYWINAYDTNGNHIRQDIYKADGSLDNYKIYTYDANGKRTGYTRYNPDGSVDEVYEY